MKKMYQILMICMIMMLSSYKCQAQQFSNKDVACLAETIYREAGGESLKGQYAVATVIMNRIRAGIADSPCSVTKQHSGKHWQFGFNATGRKAIPKKRQEYFSIVAAKVLDGSDELSLPSDVLYFNNKPFKSKRYKLYCVIGHQRFYTSIDGSISAIRSIPLYGSHEVLLHQNKMAEQEGLEQIKDDKELDYLVATQALVPIPTSQHLAVDKRLPKNRRYCRPWVAAFLIDVSDAYYREFEKPLVVDSAVRTIKVQRHLLRINRNAAAISGDAASPHLTGIAVDINKHNFSKEELAWMRNYLTFDGLIGNIDVEEEFLQKCFHISVYDKYTWR